MYIEHPFKYDGVYYAKVDGELIEITREQAKVMLSFYRNNRNYYKRWKGKDDKEDDKKPDSEKKKEDPGNCSELMKELEREEKEAERRGEKEAAESETMYQEGKKRKTMKGSGAKKRKMIVPREMILDCVFRDNEAGISIEDLSGAEPLSAEGEVMKALEYQELYEKISRLPEQDRHIIEEVFFKKTPQVELAEALGITPQTLHSRLTYCLIRLRRLYIFG
ncbi:MAG: sigma-70 family RNA polymerase sigma factor [Blautia sp.]|nr:sigma-70 family RNA polymerase sigma factor [Blautia sp.]